MSKVWIMTYPYETTHLNPAFNIVTWANFEEVS